MNLNKTWFYYGNGIDSFGKHDLWEEREFPKIKENEVLARVDAVAICASDVKMIKMANEYPLFRNRDFKTNPAVLGHELSLTIVEVGENLKADWKPGIRIGVQPDVYMDSVRYCIGVTVDGGMQKYMVLQESVFNSDYGVTVFPVSNDLSYAEVSLLEPNACIEAAYRPFSRTQFSEEANLVVYLADDIEKYDLDLSINHKSKHFVKNLTELKEIKDPFQDVLIIGNPEEEIIEYIIQNLDVNSVFCWLADEKTNIEISCDIAKIHYDKIFFTGTCSKKLSDAFSYTADRFSLKKNGNLLIVGGAGAMGRMHTLRAIMDPEGPNVIVVTARGETRIHHLIQSFEEVAKKKNKQLIGVATKQDGWEEKLKSIAPNGFDDVVVCAPGIDPVDEGKRFLNPYGKLILFSGTKYGTYTKLPIGWIPSFGLKLNASSGSSVDDEKEVLSKIEKGIIDPNKNVAAIAGFNAVKKALQAVSDGLFPGKVILYPQLDNLPLVSITNLDEISDELYNYVEKNGWNHQAEKLMFKHYLGKEDL